MMYCTGREDVTEPVERAHTAVVNVPPSPYVLVVDDDEAILSVVMLLLETEAFAGVGFSDSREVLPFLRRVGAEHLPAIILLDLMMPVISGYDIAAQLSRDEQFSRIPIIVMTADSRVKNISAVPGAVDMLSKPFQLTALLTKLEPFLS